ncbi:MAG: ATP-dependent zinc metalloprotease FtsH [Candidatus Fimivicinus sp.]|nr:ATP-dependent zinc metalloprotease FtsH [Oscillospiraceae bacterium]MDY5591698.1 ATP-dependent zinc metalloprotease FtsH [Candidatus Fimivicinus sp.]
MDKKRNWRVFLPYLLLPIVLILALSFFTTTQNRVKTEYYQIVQYFDQGEVTAYRFNLSSRVLEYQLKGSNEWQKYTVPNANLFIEDVHESVRDYNKAHPDAPIKYDMEAGSANSWWVSLLPTALMIVLLIGGLVYMTRRMNQTMTNETNRTMSFGKARVKQVKDEKRKTTFEDVAGADEEKEELSEIVAFLKEPRKFNDLGARIPKGVLLVGPPGTGKTLLARAVAGEANVPFFSISGSDFVEMYVGVGASRVRDLFEQAKKNSPAIIFIDEIDAVGRHRGAGMGGGHDEREQTLNQLLVEMDGFGANEGVIIIAATNRPDILDPALLRPGRFDRQVTVGYPDLKGREAILKVHAKGKPLAPDVDLNVIARSTVGFTGADLENLLNEAALLAARRNQKAITMTEIEEATIKVVVGTEKKSHKMSSKEKKLTAYHEAGHAVATFFLPSQDPVHQISIIPRGMAGGYTMSMPKEDKSYTSKNDMLDELVVLLGGRVAEALILGDISTGASNDIERATEIARKMVTKYGMSETLGPIAFGSGNDEVFLGRDFSHTRNYSENVASEIDEEINRIIVKAYNRCRSILEEHQDKLHKVAHYLYNHEKVDGDLFKELMTNDTLPMEPMAEDAEPSEPQDDSNGETNAPQASAQNSDSIENEQPPEGN